MCFLQWALPQLHMRWPGFRKVRRQVCKRVDRRIRELGLADVEDYRSWLEQHADEWANLETLCQITISRFYRDRAVFDILTEQVLPTLADDARRRARAGRYTFGSLKELPARWRDRAFDRDDDTYCLEPEYRHGVRFLQQDIRAEPPQGCFDLVLCRNLVFTYFDVERQREILKRIVEVMHDGAALVLGAHEHLPDTAYALSAWFENRAIYRRVSAAANFPVRHTVFAGF